MGAELKNIYFKTMGTPKLGLWHCQALYVLTPMDLKKVSQTAAVELRLIAETAKTEGWLTKKKKYAQLNETQRQDLDVIDLLLGFENSEQRSFAAKILEKLAQNQKDEAREEVKKQKVAQLGEFGMSAEQAELFLSEYESSLNGSNPGDYAVEAELSVQQKLDTINAGYKFFTASLNGGLSECHDVLREAIGFYSRMVKDMNSKYPANASFEELVGYQRPASYTAQALAKLVGEYAALSGVNGYVNHHAAIAKMFANGYHVVHKDALGRMVNNA